MNLLHSSHGKRAPSAEESYDPRQLQLLRMANYLIQTADKRLLDSLDVLLGALLNAEQHKTSAAASMPSAPPGGGLEGSGSSRRELRFESQDRRVERQSVKGRTQKAKANSEKQDPKAKTRPNRTFLPSLMRFRRVDFSVTLN